MQRRALCAEVAGLGQLRWFLGNVYEAGVDMPQLLAAVDGTLPLNGPPLVSINRQLSASWSAARAASAWCGRRCVVRAGTHFGRTGCRSGPSPAQPI